MDKQNYNKTRRACLFSYLAMSSVFSMPPLLFMTFQRMYGISYTLLGTLVLINFCTQLTIDLIFSFFSKHFNIKLTVRIMPLITALGLFVYAFVPHFAEDYAFVGLLIGTFLFSIASGLCEVLLSPIIAAIPSEHPERDMSALHSLYAWGVVSVVIITSLFIHIFGDENWMWLTVFFALFPVIACIMFCISPIPDFNVSQSEISKENNKRTSRILLCMICIFLGSASENVMTNWISGYLENALGISKQICDIIGMAVFAILLGLHRTIYAKKGGKIWNTLFYGMLGAFVCYIVTGVSGTVITALIACVLLGYFTSMLWPGTLILMEENIPSAGIAAYALMAAGGDMGAALAPQMMGVIVDKVALTDIAVKLGKELSLSPEQIGMKFGMIITALFPLLGIVVLLIIRKKFNFKANK